MRQKQLIFILAVLGLGVFVFSIVNLILRPRVYKINREGHSHDVTLETAEKRTRLHSLQHAYWSGEDSCNAKRNSYDKEFHFRPDGSFRIAIFTDLHFSCGYKCLTDHNGQLLMDSVLDSERPDLVVFAGDTIQSEGGPRKPTIMLDAFAPTERRQIPFVAIFGNHDSDGPDVVTRHTMLENLQRCSHARTPPADVVAQNDDSYVHVLKGTRANMKMYFLDTFKSGVLSDFQVDWLRNQNDKKLDNLLSSLVFMHVPPKEYKTEICKDRKACYGTQGEKIESAPQNVENGFFDVYKQLDGKMRMIVTGHDHLNDMCGVTSTADQGNHVLCYARSTGYGGYGGQRLEKGSRIIHINEFTESIYTYVVTADQRREQLQYLLR